VFFNVWPICPITSVRSRQHHGRSIRAFAVKRRAAKRLRGLTAQHGRANCCPCRDAGPTIECTLLRTMSDRWSAGFLTSIHLTIINARNTSAAQSRQMLHLSKRKSCSDNRSHFSITPRKCLGFKTPFAGDPQIKELGKDVQIRFA
jgi:hypothetical protein